MSIQWTTYKLVSLAIVELLKAASIRSATLIDAPPAGGNFTIIFELT